MTEDEAKTKWCPFARILGEGKKDDGSRASGTINRGQGIQTPCLASACMAWRWREEKRTAAFLEAVQAHMQAQPKPNFNTATQAVYAEKGGSFERTEGFCGLAGSPS